MYSLGIHISASSLSITRPVLLDLLHSHYSFRFRGPMHGPPLTTTSASVMSGTSTTRHSRFAPRNFPRGSPPPARRNGGRILRVCPSRSTLPNCSNWMAHGRKRCFSGTDDDGEEEDYGDDDASLAASASPRRRRARAWWCMSASALFSFLCLANVRAANRSMGSRHKASNP